MASCDVVGEQHLGYILDPSQCKYDPTLDVNVLCVADGGTNATSSCLAVEQAEAVNKIWYGATVDGTVPAPRVDLGWSPTLSSMQKWYGLPRGAPVNGPPFSIGDESGPFGIASDITALILQDPTIATPSFQNATGNGANNWKLLSYEQLMDAFDRGLALQSAFADVDANNPNLTAFRARGRKLIIYQGLADQIIAPQGTIRYYNEVIGKMGGLAATQKFFRLFLTPGWGHAACTPTETNQCITGTANAVFPRASDDDYYNAVVDWVEKGIAPDQFVGRTSSADLVTRSQPICAYPKKAVYRGRDPNIAASYRCKRVSWKNGDADDDDGRRRDDDDEDD